MHGARVAENLTTQWPRNYESGGKWWL